MLEGQIKAYYASDYSQKVILDSIPTTFKFYLDSAKIKAILATSGVKDSIEAKIESGLGTTTEIE